MPYKIITEAVIDEMIDTISLIKLNTYIKLPTKLYIKD